MLIERVWPNGWQPDFSESTLDAALIVAAVSESAGLNKTKLMQTESIDGLVSPFQTLNRRYP